MEGIDVLELYEKNKGETSKEYAYRVLKENIMNLNLKPGKVISESEVAEWFELSRTPVREVVMKLKDEHLIEVIPQKGTYVSLIDLGLMKEGTFVRSVLEKEVLKIACNGINEKYIEELEMNIFAYSLIVGKENSKMDMHILDNKFHEIIFSSVGMNDIWESIQRLSTHYNRVRLISELNKPQDTHILDEHKKILELIKNGNKEIVNDVVKKHIEEPTENWYELYSDDSEFKEYFKK